MGRAPVVGGVPDAEEGLPLQEMAGVPEPSGFGGGKPHCCSTPLLSSGDGRSARAIGLHTEGSPYPMPLQARQCGSRGSFSFR